MRKIDVTVSPSALLSLSVLIAVLDWHTAAEVLSAALLHEFGHLIAMALCNVKVESVSFEAVGPKIGYTQIVSYGVDVFVAAAGPVMSLSVALIAACMNTLIGSIALQEFSGLNLLYCILNIIPICTTDGGRIFGAVLALFLGSGPAWYIQIGVSLAMIAGLFADGLVLFVKSEGNFSLILCAIFLLKACCKEKRSSVKSFHWI